MDRARKLVLQRRMNAALPLHPRHAFEGGRDQPDMEMGFAPAAIIARGAGMTGMAGALVLDVQGQGRECGCQLLADIGGDTHKAEVLLCRGKVKQYVSLSFTLSIP